MTPTPPRAIASTPVAASTHSHLPPRASVPPPALPRVHIGSVEVVVAAPAERRAAPSVQPAPTSNLASRLYLRNL